MAESVFQYLRKATVVLLAVKHILVHDKIVALLIVYVTLEVVTAATLDYSPLVHDVRLHSITFQNTAVFMIVYVILFKNRLILIKHGF